jgi:hypothetical protein
MSSPSTRTYAPPPQTDPMRLASVTLKAVDQIGAGAGDEIDRAAAQIEAGAKEIADLLRELSAAVRDHCAIAAERVSAFCERSNEVLGTIRGLKDRISAQVEPADAKTNGHGDPVPSFLRNGNGAEVRS